MAKNRVGRNQKYIMAMFMVLILLFVLQRLVVPKYMHGIVEGAMIAEYYEEEKDHDVRFIGDGELYENISPAVRWTD